MGIVPFSNVYDDAQRADAYAKLEFPGTYYLAFRDLPGILTEHVAGRVALDFGCGTGRSTRFLKNLGFEVAGIDTSARMIDAARTADPRGSYQLVRDGDFAGLAPASFDLVLSAFAFDNIPDVGRRQILFRGLRRLLKNDGRLVILGSTPEIYVHEWASFTTREFPQNRTAKSGEVVRIVMKDVDDRRPVVDLVWFREDYLDLFAASSFEVILEHKPLGSDGEPHTWLTETSVAPWVIYVARPR